MGMPAFLSHFPRGTWTNFRQVIGGKKRMTVEFAARVNGVLNGAPLPIAAPKKRAARAIVLSTPSTPTPRPARELGMLRLDAGHTLAARFGGSLTELARASGITTLHLQKFLAGGGLPPAEAAALAASVASGPRVAMPIQRRAGHGSAIMRARKLLARLAPEAIAILTEIVNEAEGGHAHDDE